MLNCRRLLLSEAPEVVKLLTDAFPLSAPHSWGRALGFGHSVEKYMSSYVPIPISSELGSYGAYIREKGEENEQEKLVGTILIEPFDHDDHTESISNSKYLTNVTYTQPYDAIAGLIDACNNLFYRELMQRFPEDHRRLTNKERTGGYVAWIGTDEAYRRKHGIASSLIQQACVRMQESPFSYSCAIAYCVSPMATKAFQKNGFELWNQIEYKSFAMRNESGEDVFPYLILPDEVSILVRRF